MITLLKKEMKLTASPLSYLFILFGLLAFLPGYPILIGTFFLCLGLFQSFQSAREANDMLYTALLPVAKRDMVKGKYMFCIVIEFCYVILTTVPVLVRMTVWSDAAVYRSNALMNANLVYLGFVFLMLGLFNLIFVGGFFKTGYQFARPFVAFIIVAFFVVGIGETLFHIPALSALNAFGFTHIGLQAGVWITGAVTFTWLTAVSMCRAIKRFERVDL